jgi:hypothetical protein
MGATDLADLPAHVGSSAIVLDNGEVLWPFERAVEAINELAHLDRVVLGVDARERSAGLVAEVPISDYRPSGRASDVELGRQHAVDAVDRAEAVTGWHQPLILVTW